METLKKLRLKNIERCPFFEIGNIKDISLEYKAIEIAGEMGELLNVIKKKLRGDLISFDKGEEISVDEQLKDELADVIICIDLLAAKYDIDLSDAIHLKFNKTSDKRNIKVFM